MLRAAAILLLALPLPAQDARSKPAASPRDHLGPFFARAKAAPEGVVPLILEGSSVLDALAESDPTQARLLADTLEPFCARAFFSPERLPRMEELGLTLHTVRSGEVPERIAKRYRIGAGLFEHLNPAYDERRLKEGQALKVLDLSDGGLEIVVRRGSYRLAVRRARASGGPLLLMHVPVGVGAPESPTPLGDTTITARVREPEWTDPDTKRVYAPREPGNVLGGYWIALASEGLGRSGIGLHGFTGQVVEKWIEQPGSHGCVRMLQRDVDRVFHVALEGTPVSIRP